MTTNTETKDTTTTRVTQRSLPSVDIRVAKDVERMKLRDGTITPDMVRYLNSIEVVEALLRN